MENNETLTKEQEEKILNDINQALTKDLFSPIKQIYVDWSYIQDIYLGAIISLCKSQEDYSYILNQLSKYNDRLIRGHASYFSKFNYTDTDLETYINNNKLEVISRSPMTNIFKNLKDLTNRIILRNSKLGYKEPVRIIFNLYPINITQEDINILKYILKPIFTDTDNCFIAQPINSIHPDRLIECDILLIDRMDIFLSDREALVYKYFVNEPLSKFINSAIITLKVIDNKEIQAVLEEKTKEEIEQIFKTTAAVCGLLTDFIYINPVISIDKPTDNQNQ